MTNLPDLARSFQQMKLIDMIANTPNTSKTAQYWALAAHEHPQDVIKEVFDQMEDNAPAVERLIGYKAAEMFHQLYPHQQDRYRARQLTNQIDLC